MTQTSHSEVELGNREQWPAPSLQVSYQARPVSLLQCACEVTRNPNGDSAFREFSRRSLGARQFTRVRELPENKAVLLFSSYSPYGLRVGVGAEGMAGPR